MTSTLTTPPQAGGRPAAEELYARAEALVPVLRERARTAEGIAGTGIGLNFVSQIMALHGGRIDIRSIEGKGSTFTLLFPYRAVDAPARTAMVAG